MHLSLILSLVATIFSSAEMVFGLSLRSGKLIQPSKVTHQGDYVNSASDCLVGNGESYRGFMRVSGRGRTCLPWKGFPINEADILALGNHNYCRNTDNSIRPWCRVRRRKNIVRELCDIPQCAPEIGSPDVSSGTIVPLTSQMDTESTCGERELPRFKVVGGAMVTIEAQPWIAAIFLRGRFLCGASLIAPCWVLTAAHCLLKDDDSPISARHVTVYLGRNSITEEDSIRQQKFSVDKLILHLNYTNNNGNYDNDIGLLKLQSKDGVCAVKMPSVRTVCLPPPHIMLPPGAICGIAGYGRTREGAWQYSNDLRHAKVALLSQTVCKCKDYYGNLITNNMFCAGSPDWKTDACQGDSGGPLVCEVGGRAFVFGVVSWGDGCARKNKPGVYTRITNYNSWIAQNTGLPAYTAGVMYPQK